jgi:hypothetical protein
VSGGATQPVGSTGGISFELTSVPAKELAAIKVRMKGTDFRSNFISCGLFGSETSFLNRDQIFDPFWKGSETTGIE